MSEAGWVQWHPGQKHHHLTRDVDGWYGTACDAWRADGIGSRKLLTDVPEKKKCKLCIRALQRSDERGDKDEED